MVKIYNSIDDALNSLDLRNTLFITRSHVEVDIPDASQRIKYTGKALPLEDVQELYNSIVNKSVENIVAIGGGTIIDIAKVIALALSNGLSDLKLLLNPNKEFVNTLNIIAVPTTCGSGSEATHFAVVYYNRTKHSIATQTILPNTVILDSKLLITLPLEIRNATVLDALAQGIESLWANNATSESKTFAKDAITHIIRGINEVDNTRKIELLQLGSYLAGKAINISKTTVCHAISYYLTANHGIPHGVAVFLTIPEVAKINYFGRENDVFDFLFNVFDVSNIDSLKERLEDVIEQFGFSKHLTDYGIQKMELDLIAKQSVVSGRSDNNPVPINPKLIKSILLDIY